MKIQFTASVFLIFASTFSYAASFDCNKASNFIEKAICNDRQLSKLDEMLSENYKNMSAANIGDGVRKDLKATQRTWVTTRSKCTDNACLANSYKKRIDEICDYPVLSGMAPACKSSDDAEADLVMAKPSAPPSPKTITTSKAGTNSSKTNIIIGDGNAHAVVQFLELYQGYVLVIKEARASGRYNNKATCLTETKAMWRNVLKDSPSLINLDSVTIEGSEFPALWKACT